MTSGDHYRVRAAEFHAQSQSESNPAIKEEYENLARAYLRLAMQADRMKSRQRRARERERHLRREEQRRYDFGS
jgi:hypothetical protein